MNLTNSAAEWVDIGELKPWDKNPRKNKDAVESVAHSIKRWGFASPIVARRADGRIIAGHTRWLAAKSIGCTQVPVRFLDLDEAEAAALAIADNRLGEIAKWDFDLLAELKADGVEIGEFELPSVDVDLDVAEPGNESDPAEGQQQKVCPVCGK